MKTTLLWSALSWAWRRFDKGHLKCRFDSCACVLLKNISCCWPDVCSSQINIGQLVYRVRHTKKLLAKEAVPWNYVPLMNKPWKEHFEAPEWNLFMLLYKSDLYKKKKKHCCWQLIIAWTYNEIYMFWQFLPVFWHVNNIPWPDNNELRYVYFIIVIITFINIAAMTPPVQWQVRSRVSFCCLLFVLIRRLTV